MIIKEKVKKIFVAIIIILFFVFVYFFFYEPRYDGLIGNWEGTRIIAHRGFGNYAPDNGLSGVKLALDNKMDGVDLDGQLTKDGELVIFHDLRVDRLTNGAGYVRDKTLEELKELDLGIKLDESFIGEKISTFEEIVKEVNGQAILMVELKVSELGDTGVEKKAVEIIQRNGAHDYVYLSSFNPIVLYRLKKLDKNIRTVFIFMDTNWNEDIRKEVPSADLKDLPFFLRSEFTRRAIRKIIEPDLLSVNKEVDEKTIERLISKGWPIFLWPLDSEEDLEKSLEKKPYGIITNEPISGRSLRDE